MAISIPIDRMTPAEKYEAFQLLWEDLCRQDTVTLVPQWHEQALREREVAVEQGKDPSHTLDEAKQLFWERMGWK